MKLLITDKRNAFDFFLRSNLALTRRKYQESGLTLSQMLESLQPLDRIKVAELVDNYQLEPFLRRLARPSFVDNMLHLLLLDVVAPYFDGPCQRVLDIGSKNFCYVVALHQFFKSLDRESGGSRTRIEGIELDSKRVYSNLYSRAACANYYAKLVPQAFFRQGDLLRASFSKPYDVVCHFFPFLDRESLLDWGLPLRYYRPLEMVRKCFEIVRPGGYFFMTNVDEDEFHHGRSLVEMTSFEFICSQIVEHAYTITPLFVSLFRKAEDAS